MDLKICHLELSPGEKYLILILFTGMGFLCDLEKLQIKIKF